MDAGHELGVLISSIRTLEIAQLGSAMKPGAPTDLAVPVVVRQQLLPGFLIQRALRVRVDQQALDGLYLSALSCSSCSTLHTASSQRLRR